MAFIQYYQHQCPSCNRIYKTTFTIKAKAGSPILTCPKCGKPIIDTNMKEPAAFENYITFPEKSSSIYIYMVFFNSLDCYILYRIRLAKWKKKYRESKERLCDIEYKKVLEQIYHGQEGFLLDTMVVQYKNYYSACIVQENESEKKAFKRITNGKKPKLKRIIVILYIGIIFL